MEYVIGIDGGGTKTRAWMVDGNGIVTASTACGPTNPNALTFEELRQTLALLIDDLFQQNSAPLHNVTHLFAGIAGAGEKENQDKIKRILLNLLPPDIHIEVFPDAINALYSGTYGKPGIVQISGTGSISYGINKTMQHARVGGWGYLFGDEGSGYDMGKQGVIAALKSIDGRGSATILLEMLYAHFNVVNEQDLIKEIYSSHSPKGKIAPLSKLVFQAYYENDAIAKAIVINAVKEIAHSIVTLYGKLFDRDEHTEVVLCGGLFNDKDLFPSLLKKELDTTGILCTLVIPEIPPVGGSVIGAFLSKYNQVDKKLIEALKSVKGR